MTKLAPVLPQHSLVIVIPCSFVAARRPPVARSAPSSPATRHAYAPRGAAPLCGEHDWREVAPDAEVTCPDCLCLLNERLVAANAGDARRAWDAFRVPVAFGARAKAIRAQPLTEASPVAADRQLTWPQEFSQCPFLHAVEND